MNRAVDNMLALAAGGVSVIPIDPGTKRPLNAQLPAGPDGPTWKPFEATPADAATLDRWRKADVQAYAGVGGDASGGLLIFDFDEERLYDPWRLATGNLSEGLCVQITGGGGWQVWLRCPNPGPNQKLAWVKDDSQDEGRRIGIETRGQGGYACGPGSLHPSGNRYAAVEGDFTKIPLVPQAQADALLAAARKLDECPLTRRQRERMATAKAKSDAYRKDLNGEASVIDEFNRRTSIDQVLEANGYRHDGDRMIRPGADAESMPGVVFFDRDGKRVSFHWSTNDSLNDGHCHDAFSAFCNLEFNGDFREAVKHAAQLMGMSNERRQNPPKNTSRDDKTPASKPQSGVSVLSAAREKTRIARAEPYRPFPVHLLPYPLRQFIKEASEAIGCDPAFIALPLLVGLAIAIGTTRRIRITFDWLEFAIVWAVVVAGSGQRKTPALDAATGPLQRLQAKWFDEHRQAMAEYKLALKLYRAAMKSAGKDGSDTPDEPDKPTPRRAIVADVTVEALAVVLQENPRRLGVVRDELSAWFGSFNQYRGGHGSDSSAYLEMHRGGTVTVDRKSGEQRTLYIPRAAASVTGTIQPGILSRCFGNDLFDSGMVARILLAAPPARKREWSEGNIQPHTADKLRSIYEHLAAMEHDSHGQPIEIPLSPEALAMFKTFVNEWGTEQAQLGDERLEAAYSKLEGYAARLALILHLVRVAINDSTLEGPGVVDVASISAGIDMARWFGYEARRVYGDLSLSSEDRDRRKLVELIKSKGGKITPRELCRACRRYEDSEAAEAALNELVGLKIGEWKDAVPGPTGGRPTHTFVISSRCVDETETPDTESRQGVSSASDPKSEGFVSTPDEAVEVTA